MISPSLQRNPELDAWIRVDPADTVTVCIGKVELGQGIKTAVARIAAEELDVAVERIRVKNADTADGPDELYTVGSNSLEESGTAVRQAAAEARAELLALAAAALGAPASALRIDDGRIAAPGGARATTYWELFGGRRFARKLPGTARPKPAQAYRILGKPGPRVGMESIVRGSLRYVQDLRPPGVVHARVVRPPRPDARLESLDDAELRRLPGVIALVRDGSFLAVVAEREDQAVAAAARLRKLARFSAPPAEEPLELAARLRATPVRSLPVVDGIALDQPAPAHATPSGVTRTLRASYTRPFLLHGSIGPAAALARCEDGALTVWTASQGISVLRVAIAQALRLPVERVRLVHVEGPGCYGHNGADDAAFDAALVACALPGRPVHVQWSREDEHAFEPCGSAMAIDLEASLDGDGRIIDWNHESRSWTHMARAIPYGERTSGLLGAWQRDPPMARPQPRPALAYHGGVHRNADPLYAFPRRRIVKHLLGDGPLRTSSLRGLGAYANVFALESFLDEIAHASGQDPVELRLRHLEDERARAVIRAAAERAGWGAPLAAGRGRGIGFARYKNQKAYCAVVVELEVDDARAQIRLARAVIAADAGQIVDPDGLANQLEGGLVQSASWTLKESVRFDASGVTSVDWESYPILRFGEVPEIETVLIDRPGEPWVGAGEASQGPTAAAIANAVFSACGLRLRDTPFTPDRLRAAALG